jgi:hypothetical protein
MNCPLCNFEMQAGSPHDDGWIYQFECPVCGCIKGVPGIYRRPVIIEETRTSSPHEFLDRYLNKKTFERGS